MNIAGTVPLFVALPLILACTLAHAQSPAAIRDDLVKAGITPSFIIDNDVIADLAGGARRGWAYAGSAHVQLALDGAAMLNVPGLTAWIDGLWLGGGKPGALTGDAQGILNMGASPALRLYEAWLQYNTPDNRLSVLAGRYDLNTEFYHLRSAGLFLNSSFGIGPEFGMSGIGGPSIFPNTALAVRFAYKPAANAVLRFAVLDGAPVDPVAGAHGPFDPHNGVLLVTEAAFVTHDSTDAPSGPNRFRIGRQSGAPGYADKLAVGAWYYTGRFADQNPAVPGTHQGQGGAYAVADHVLYQTPGDPKRRVTGFLQLGATDPRTDRFGTYVGAGLTWIGPWMGREDDEIGVALAMARNGAHYIAGQRQAGVPVSAAETAIEVSYLIQAAAWLAVQPDVQYVIHPNTDPRVRDATVAQLRVEMKF